MSSILVHAAWVQVVGPCYTVEKGVARFIWEDIFCRYGAVGQITTDNGTEVKGAVHELMKRYGIPQIKISAYNSKANGVVERGHFIIREALLKVCGKNVKQWPTYVPHAFFADKVTVRRQTGFSPFYLLYGCHPVLPFDLAEASFLVDGFTTAMSEEDLLAARIQQLAKHPEDIAQAAETLAKHRFKIKEQFERHFCYRMQREHYSPGTLVLLRNTAVEKSMDRKSKPRYNGPYEVVRRTKGGSYVLAELNGNVHKQGYAAFRLLPYVSRNSKMLESLEPSYPDNSSSDDSSEPSLSDSAMQSISDDSDM